MLKLNRETYDRAVEVADGVWMLGTRHRPGFMKMSPEVNNRCMIFRLRDGGEDVLVVANGVDPKVIPEVRRIERETRLVVKYILSVGGGHHLMLPAWRDEFQEATVLVGPRRVPNTPSARPLMQGPRVRVMDAEHPLPEFAGQLDAVVFDGLYGVRDHKTPFEGGKEPGLLSMMKMMRHIDVATDELWLRHAATGTVIAGDNLGWMFSKKTLQTFPFMMRMMFKADTVYLQDKARKVADPARVAASWRKILTWPSKTLLGYHEPPGDAFVGDGQAALAEVVRAAGQLGAN
jgi:hypothetical protein